MQLKRLILPVFVLSLFLASFAHATEWKCTNVPSKMPAFFDAAMKDPAVMKIFRDCCLFDNPAMCIGPLVAETGDRLSHIALKKGDKALMKLAFEDLEMRPQNVQVINRRPVLAKTEAMISAEKGSKEYIDMLVKHGLTSENLMAQSQHEDHLGKTAFDFAFDANHIELARYIRSLEKSLPKYRADNALSGESKDDTKLKIIDIMDPQKILAVMEKINQSRAMADWKTRS
jgi:hypothetical protein